jgi:hypothetical protein
VVVASLPPTVKTLVVTVTATDIPTPIVANVEVSGGSASKTITVPTGPSRTLTIRAYDASNVETHRGSTTITVQAGIDPTISVSLTPLQGDQRIEVRIESLVVSVVPPTLSLGVGQRVSLEAAVKTAAGEPVNAAATDIRWATLQPNVATVGSTGEVLGVSLGSATIVAVYGGVSGTAAITVEAARASDYRMKGLALLHRAAARVLK